MIKPDELLQLARELGASPLEVRRRAAISRAYYAAFQRCEAWERQLSRSGDDCGVHGTHARLIARLKHPHAVCNAAEKACSTDLGARLERQHKLRVHADYRISWTITRSMLDLQLREAEQVLDRCKRALSSTLSPPRNADTKPPHPHSPSHRAS